MVVEQGPLWSTIKQQLYRSEVSEVKRQVVPALIRQNRQMWEEINSLRQILAEFQEQNDEAIESRRQQAQLLGGQHRNLLREQARILLEDVTAQAAACGHELLDFFPKARDKELCQYARCSSPSAPELCKSYPCSSRCTTPSTSPSSSSGVSGMSTCSTPDINMPPLPLGKPLGFDDLGTVADGIRDALAAEQEALLTTISELVQQLEAEDVRRVESARAEPSTAEMQRFVQKLQELSSSPSLRTLSLASPTASPDFGDRGDAPLALSAIGGASVRRLQALIAQRRLDAPSPVPGFSPEKPLTEQEASIVPVPAALCKGDSCKPPLDPFFDDPFA